LHAGGEAARMDQIHHFFTKPRRYKKRAEQSHGGCSKTSLLREFPRRADERILAGVRRSGRNLPKCLFCRMAVLPHEDDLLRRRRRDDRKRTGVLDDVDAMNAFVFVADFVGTHGKDASAKAFLRRNDLRSRLHKTLLVRQRSPLLAEFAWLVYFLAIFAILVYLFNIFVVPHHFNDKVAAVLSGMLAALTMIATRAVYARRKLGGR
jgi:hypothetical protein